MQRLPCANVSGIAQQDTRLSIIRQIRIENLSTNALAEKFVTQRHQHFYSLVEIARHPVGAANVNFFFATILEIIDTAVLQESSDNTAHPDAIAQTANPRAQRADAANDQIDLPACLRSLVQGLDNVLVEQSIHLGDDPPRSTLPRVLGFAIDKGNGFFCEVERSHQQRIV